MLTLLLASSIFFQTEQTNNTHSIVLNPPVGATVASIQVNHNFLANHLCETDNNTSYPAMFLLEMKTRYGWRLQNLTNFTFGSTRAQSETFISGMCIPFDGTYDGAGSSGFSNNYVTPSNVTIDVPLSLVPGNILLLKSDARSYTHTDIWFTGQVEPGTFLDAWVFAGYYTYSNANVTVTYQ